MDSRHYRQIDGQTFMPTQWFHASASVWLSCCLRFCAFLWANTFIGLTLRTVQTLLSFFAIIFRVPRWAAGVFFAANITLRCVADAVACAWSTSLKTSSSQIMLSTLGGASRLRRDEILGRQNEFTSSTKHLRRPLFLCPEPLTTVGYRQSVEPAVQKCRQRTWRKKNELQHKFLFFFRNTTVERKNEKKHQK